MAKVFRSNWYHRLQLSCFVGSKLALTQFITQFGEMLQECLHHRPVAEASLFSALVSWLTKSHSWSHQYFRLYCAVFPVPLAATQSQLTVGKVFFSSDAAPFLLQTYLSTAVVSNRPLAYPNTFFPCIRHSL